MEVKQENRALPLVTYVAGLVSMFLGERVLSTINSARITLSLAGFGLVFAYFLIRLRGVLTATGERKSIDRVLTIFAGITLLGLALAFLTTEAGEKLIGIPKVTFETKNKFEAIATIAFVAFVVLSALPIFFAERALAPMRRAENIEGRRVLSAWAAGLTLGLALVYGALFTYAAGELEWKADYSFFRTSRPSESTKNIVKGLEDQVKVVLFFPPLNDVGREVASYMKDLAKASPKFTYEVHDRLLEPSLAKDWKVTQDGVLVVARGPTQESMTLGVEMDPARPKLKTLDTDFQKNLIKVSREARTAYLTTGHGEMNEGGDAAEGRTASGVRKLFESQNYTVKDLGLAQGLGVEIPKDATVVTILGPSRAFMPGEIAALKKYVDGGGHLLLALDPDGKVDLDPIAELAGLSYAPTPLANEKIHLRRRFNDSDRGILVTNRFSSHASVSTLSRNSGRAHVVFAGAAALDKRPGADASLKFDFALKAMQDTFADQNGDFAYQDSEKKTQFNLGAAVSRMLDPHAANYTTVKELRIFAIGDADALSDAVFGNEANVIMFIDAIRWLGGEESFTGAIATTEDIKIEHTKQKDLVLFYGTIFLVPAVVLGLGLALSRRSRIKSRPARAAAPPVAPEQKGAA
ncbi:MAG TPA: Gldg family protein [Polyangiaceae bacterium]|nr:Gldg family protein [Polyangiaceae bacterium]